MNKPNLIMEINLEKVKDIIFNFITFISSDQQFSNITLNEIDKGNIEDELKEFALEDIKELSSTAIISESGTSLLVGQPINDMGFHFDEAIEFHEVEFDIELLKENYLQNNERKNRKRK